MKTKFLIQHKNQWNFINKKPIKFYQFPRIINSLGLKGHFCVSRNVWRAKSASSNSHLIWIPYGDFAFAGVFSFVLRSIFIWAILAFNSFYLMNFCSCLFCFPSILICLAWAILLFHLMNFWSFFFCFQSILINFIWWISVAFVSVFSPF